MIKLKWEKLVNKIDGMTLRERVLVFAAAAFLLVSMIYALLLDPLLERQKTLAMQLIQQQEKIKEIHSQLESLVQAKASNASSPLRDRIRQIQQQIKEGEIELKNRRDTLVPPEKMGDLLESMLSKNGRLQLVGLETLAVMPLIEASSAKPDGSAVTPKPAGQEREMYKHGVKLTVRGSYADLMQYLEALEQLPMQMFWGSAKMTVVQFPSVEMTLTLYTLSMDTIWLQV